MKRSSVDTKAAILAAARERFAAVGFQGATIRAIAAEAGIDPAMVMRYFGSKDELFAAAADYNLELPDLTGVDRSRLGAAVVGHFLNRWEGDEALGLLVRSATTNADAAARMHRIFGEQLLPVVAAVVPAEVAAQRAGLIATQILGFALCRFVLELPPVVAMSRDDIVSWLGPTIQSYLETDPRADTGQL
ncbi:MAG: TetR family transcriptional regulator [Micropruina glycogenica]